MTEMGQAQPAPAPVVGFFHPQGNAVLIGELDADFLSKSSLGPSSWERPLRVELEPKLSKRGNTFFDYEQVLPLPDGLETLVAINGTSLTASEIGESQRGNPTRRHAGTAEIAAKVYEVTCFVTDSKKGFWVKLHAQIASSRSPAAPAELPKGGRLV
jgi:hypothetical protein